MLMLRFAQSADSIWGGFEVEDIQPKFLRVAVVAVDIRSGGTCRLPAAGIGVRVAGCRLQLAG